MHTYAVIVTYSVGEAQPVFGKHVEILNAYSKEDAAEQYFKKYSHLYEGPRSFEFHWLEVFDMSDELVVKEMPCSTQ